jgi:hypothetical protein
MRLMNHKLHIHINQLEMATYLLQLIAASVALSNPTPLTTYSHTIRINLPTSPQWLVYTENSSTHSWSARNTACTIKGQLLLRLKAALYYHHDIQGRSAWLPSTDNALADLLSRGLIHPLTPLSHATFLNQVFRVDSQLTTYAFFLPSPKVSSLLHWILCSSVRMGLESLPKNLGRFVTAGSTTLDGASLLI